MPVGSQSATTHRRWGVTYRPSRKSAGDAFAFPDYPGVEILAMPWSARPDVGDPALFQREHGSSNGQEFLGESAGQAYIAVESFENVEPRCEASLHVCRPITMQQI
jgi:hypothetical protein